MQPTSQFLIKYRTKKHFLKGTCIDLVGMVTHNEKAAKLAEYIYIDFSNLSITAQYLSGDLKQLSQKVAGQSRVSECDSNHKIDVRRLHDILTGGSKSDIAKIALFGSRSRSNDDAGFWQVVHNLGFKNCIQVRQPGSGEKQVDTSLVVDMMIDALQIADQGDIFTLVAGDSDYLPMVKRLAAMNIRVDVIFWDHASDALKLECSNFSSLNEHFDLLTFKSEY